MCAHRYGPIGSIGSTVYSECLHCGAAVLCDSLGCVVGVQMSLLVERVKCQLSLWEEVGV